VRRAIAAGKHIYCEKPVSGTLAEALSLANLARQKGVKSGVVQDKLYLPGLRKIRMLLCRACAVTVTANCSCLFWPARREDSFQSSPV